MASSAKQPDSGSAAVRGAPADSLNNFFSASGALLKSGSQASTRESNTVSATSVPFNEGEAVGGKKKLSIPPAVLEVVAKAKEKNGRLRKRVTLLEGELEAQLDENERVEHCSQLLVVCVALCVITCLIASNFITYVVTTQLLSETTVSTYKAKQVSKTNFGGSAPPKNVDSGLPKDLSPTFYNLSLAVYWPGQCNIPREKVATFDAVVLIEFEVEKSTDVIVLNAMNLAINDSTGGCSGCLVQELGSSSVKKSSSDRRPLSRELRDVKNAEKRPQKQPEVTKFLYDETLQTASFYLDKKLKAEKRYVMRIPYSGVISQDLVDFYLHTRQERDGTLRNADVLINSASNMRQMVPSFDEPGFQAAWRVQVLHPYGSWMLSDHDRDISKFVRNPRNGVLAAKKDLVEMKSDDSEPDDTESDDTKPTFKQSVDRLIMSSGRQSKVTFDKYVEGVASVGKYLGLL